MTKKIEISFVFTQQFMCQTLGGMFSYFISKFLCPFIHTNYPQKIKPPCMNSCNRAPWYTGMFTGIPGE